MLRVGVSNQVFHPGPGAPSVATLAGTVWSTAWALWLLLLATPFPFIANRRLVDGPARLPALGVYGLLRTADGPSTLLTTGNVLFSLIGFAGMYTVLSILWVVPVVQHVEHGPEA
jgi:cytochrome bd ubiquinol oxidase subunit I